MGLQSSAYERTPAIESTPSINAKIFTNDIEITSELLGGDAGLFRFFFSFTTGADYEITVTKLGLADLTGSPLKLNADNSFVLRSDGYYRFDIGVRVGDKLNLSSSVAITKINEIQIQQIQIGA